MSQFSFECNVHNLMPVRIRHDFISSFRYRHRLRSRDKDTHEVYQRYDQIPFVDGNSGVSNVDGEAFGAGDESVVNVRRHCRSLRLLLVKATIDVRTTCGTF